MVRSRGEQSTSKLSTKWKPHKDFNLLKYYWGFSPDEQSLPLTELLPRSPTKSLSNWTIDLGWSYNVLQSDREMSGQETSLEDIARKLSIWWNRRLPLTEVLLRGQKWTKSPTNSTEKSHCSFWIVGSINNIVGPDTSLVTSNNYTITSTSPINLFRSFIHLIIYMSRSH